MCRNHQTVLLCNDFSRAEPSSAQAIRELPLLHLTSLTRFADNTHIFLFFLFFLSLSFLYPPPLSAYVCVRGKLILCSSVFLEHYVKTDLQVYTRDLIGPNIRMNCSKEPCSCEWHYVGVIVRLHLLRYLSIACDCCVWETWEWEEREKACCWLAYMNLVELSAQPSWDRLWCLWEEEGERGRQILREGDTAKRAEILKCGREIDRRAPQR